MRHGEAAAARVPGGAEALRRARRDAAAQLHHLHHLGRVGLEVPHAARAVGARRRQVAALRVEGEREHAVAVRLERRELAHREEPELDHAVVEARREVPPLGVVLHVADRAARAQHDLLDLAAREAELRHLVRVGARHEPLPLRVHRERAHHRLVRVLHRLRLVAVHAARRDVEDLDERVGARRQQVRAVRRVPQVAHALGVHALERDRHRTAARPERFCGSGKARSDLDRISRHWAELRGESNNSSLAARLLAPRRRSIVVHTVQVTPHPSPAGGRARAAAPRGAAARDGGPFCLPPK